MLLLWSNTYRECKLNQGESNRILSEGRPHLEGHVCSTDFFLSWEGKSFRVIGIAVPSTTCIISVSFCFGDTKDYFQRRLVLVAGNTLGESYQRMGRLGLATACDWFPLQ